MTDSLPLLVTRFRVRQKCEVDRASVSENSGGSSITDLWYQSSLEGKKDLSWKWDSGSPSDWK